jgi:hypothetical protein
MTHNNLVRGIIAVILMLGSVPGLTACDAPPSPGELGENQQILASCPAGKKLDTLIEWDGTTSNASTDTNNERLQIVRQLARRTAVCGGRLTISVFSTSSGSTATVYDGDFALPGATDNARLRHVPDAVEAAMAKVRNNLAPAIASLPTGGTDINGIYRLAGEQQAQLGDNYQLLFILLTDGMNNLGGVVLDGNALSTEQASALADQVPVPQLPGAQITVAGLGRLADGSAPSDLVAGLVAYYDRLCVRTGAASCLSVTDWR